MEGANAQSTTRALATAAEATDADSELALAAQLKRGFRTLRFDAPLETSFRIHFAAQTLFRGRIMAGVALVAVLLAAAAQLLLQPDAALGWAHWSRLAAVVPCLALGLVTSFTPLGRNHPGPVAMAVIAAIALLLVPALVVFQQPGVSLAYEPLLLLLMAAYFLAGLRFEQAVALGLAILAAFVAGQLIMAREFIQWSQPLLYLSAANLFGVIGAYFYDYLTRKAYLTTELLRTQAQIDGLTGLHNRRYLDTDLPRLWEQARREGCPLAVAVFDVDYFKAYNDTYGHLAGDDCLRSVAAVLRAEARRPLDLAIRYGGEEFLAIWFDPGGSRAVDGMVERVRRQVESLGLPHAASSADIVTVSGGAVVAIPNRLRPPETFLASADRALYRAKKNGRNCTCRANVHDVTG